MRHLIFTFIVCILFSPKAYSQSKKSMSPDVYSEWNRIKNVKVSNDGNWVLYQLTREVGDKTLKIFDAKNDFNYTFNRVKKASFDYSGKYAFFMVEHSFDGLRDLKRKKTKDKDLPKDTLCIYNLENKVLTKIPNVKSFSTPKDWGGYIAFLLEPDQIQDTIKTPVKESKETGSKLIVQNLISQKKDTLFYAKDYVFAEKNEGLSATSLGAENITENGVYNYNFELSEFEPILETKGEVYNLSWHENADHLAFIVDNDTTENLVRPYELYYYNGDSRKTKKVADAQSSFLEDGYNVSNYTKPKFSKDGNRLMFWISPPAILQDTSLLKDEIVDVEVWHFDEDKLYTEQENDLKNERKRDYICIYSTKNQSVSIVGDELYDRILMDEHNQSPYVIGQHTTSYDKQRMWKGFRLFDGYRIDITTGKKKQFVDGARGRMVRSPSGKFCFWYDASIGGHWSYDIENDKVHSITSKEIGVFGDELNDRPMDPSPYGYEGFSDEDQFLILYDRYDIWLVDPRNQTKPSKITNGRSDQKVYRIIDLDPEQRTTSLNKPLLIHVFNEKDKSESYVSLDIENGNIKELFHGSFRLDKSPIKAKEADVIITTKENYKVFPNLVLTDSGFDEMKTITDANPQQKEYLWGDIQLHSWESETGELLDGLIVLPEGFDPKKKYPLLVNFYERSSNGLHRHRAPYAHRSTINYSYYSSKGYIIFNPDIVYRVGYPGQSCYESVIPGVKSLIAKGFIDEDRIGVQGHSWGGYQIADLLTKTDMFACAEAGAPVVNMVSAYGGIRWGSGMSRMFQYEKTQSRLGATLWERPDLYLENSPIFKMDKVTTPVLILHNDRDGAVPWYQGIEYFNALRRLEKPSWFLNYNDEPHWPVKWQNRLDFNKRMEQFFDYYLMDAPMPRWMEEGVPAINKGIDQGLDYKK